MDAVGAVTTMWTTAYDARLADYSSIHCTCVLYLHTCIGTVLYYEVVKGEACTGGARQDTGTANMVAKQAILVDTGTSPYHSYHSYHFPLSSTSQT